MPLTNDPRDPRLKPKPEGMQDAYLVLSDEERAKGFVRPVRTSYRHVGARPKYHTRPLTAEEHERYDKFGYVAFEGHPDSDKGGPLGRYWTQAQLDSGCGTETTMGQQIAETYARDPKFYGATFCVQCNKHLPVGENGEFVWLDGTRVGT